MSRPISLAHLTMLDLPPPAMIDVAAAAGYTHVGLRLLASTPGGLAYPLRASPDLIETRSRLDATGVAVLDIEIVRLRPDSDVTAFLPLFETGAALGARHVLVGGSDPDPDRLADRFAWLCDAAVGFGLTLDLEPMPWTETPDIAAAARVLGTAARPNSGILIDALHFDRSASTLPELRALPPEWLHYAQLCDGPAEQPATTEAMVHAARCERLFPGEGGIDLAAILGALPAELPISLEVPTETLARTVGPAERARRAMAATQALLA